MYNQPHSDEFETELNELRGKINLRDWYEYWKQTPAGISFISYINDQYAYILSQITLEPDQRDDKARDETLRGRLQSFKAINDFISNIYEEAISAEAFLIEVSQESESVIV